MEDFFNSFNMKIEISYTIPEHIILEHCQDRIEQVFENTYFDICRVREVLTLLEYENFRDTKFYKFLENFHCIDFNKINPVMLNEIKELCYSLVNIPEKQLYYENELV